jgi:hypothetical protein
MPATLLAFPPRGSAIAATRFQYRGYVIEYDPPPVPFRDMDWRWQHDDYDGPGDDRIGFSPSLAEARQEIDDLENERDPAPAATVFRNIAAFIAFLAVSWAAVAIFGGGAS